MLIILIELFPQISQEIRACLFLFLKWFSLGKQSISIYAFTYLCPSFTSLFFGGKISSVLSPVKLDTAKASFSQVAIPIMSVLQKERSLLL